MANSAPKKQAAANHASADPANPAPEGSPTAQQAAAESSSPVLQVIQKRIRYVRKRLRTISEIEAKRDAGKALNADQEESLRAKSSLVGLEEELERLAAMIKPALDEQLATATEQAAAAARSEAEAAAAEQIKAAEEQLASKLSSTPPGFSVDAVHKLIGLIYLAQVFGGHVADVPAELTAACKALKGKVTQQQLGALANVGLAVGTPDEAAKTHQEALTACQAAAVAVMHVLNGDEVEEDAAKVAGVAVKDVATHLPQLLGSNFMRGNRTKARRAVAAGGRSTPSNAGVNAVHAPQPAEGGTPAIPHTVPPPPAAAPLPSPVPADVVPVGKQVVTNPTKDANVAEFAKAAQANTNGPSRNPYFFQQQQQQQQPPQPHAHYVPGVMHNPPYHHHAQYGQHAALDPTAAVTGGISGYALPDTVNSQYGFVPTDQAPEPESPEPGRPSNPSLTNVPPPPQPTIPPPHPAPATADAIITTATITTASGGRIVTAQRGGGGRGGRYNRGDGGRGRGGRDRVVTMPRPPAPPKMDAAEPPIQFGTVEVLDDAMTVQVPPPRSRYTGRGGHHHPPPPQATV